MVSIKSLQEEANEWAEGYIEEYAINELGFDPDGYDKDEILSAMNMYEQRMKQKRGA